MLLSDHDEHQEVIAEEGRLNDCVTGGGAATCGDSDRPGLEPFPELFSTFASCCAIWSTATRSLKCSAVPSPIMSMLLIQSSCPLPGPDGDDQSERNGNNAEQQDACSQKHYERFSGEPDVRASFLSFEVAGVHRSLSLPSEDENEGSCEDERSPQRHCRPEVIHGSRL